MVYKASCSGPWATSRASSLLSPHPFVLAASWILIKPPQSLQHGQASSLYLQHPSAPAPSLPPLLSTHLLWGLSAAFRSTHKLLALFLTQLSHLSTAATTVLDCLHAKCKLLRRIGTLSFYLHSTARNTATEKLLVNKWIKDDNQRLQEMRGSSQNPLTFDLSTFTSLAWLPTGLFPPVFSLLSASVPLPPKASF